MDENGVKLVCFEIYGAQFAFSTDYLVEIVQVHEAEITPFFSPIPIVRGKWNYRGKTVHLIDLRDFFGLTEKKDSPQMGSEPSQLSEQLATKARSETKNVLVVNIRGRIFGVFTDSVLHVLPLGDFYEYPALISTLPRRYFAGVTRIKADLVLLLAIEEFIQPYELESLLGEA